MNPLGRPVRVSAIHHAHLIHGATFRDAGDWRVPDAFTSPEDEVARALAGVGLADVSAAGKLHVRGATAAALVDRAAGNAPPPPGRAARVLLGGAEALVCRLADDELLVLTPLADTDVVRDRLARTAASAGCAHVTDLTSGFAAVDVLGPAAPSLLARVAPLDLSAAAVPPLGVVQGEVACVRAILIRLDRARAPAFRALVPREYGAHTWEALAHAGRDLGLVLVGAAARARLDAPLSPTGGEGRGQGAV